MGSGVIHDSEKSGGGGHENGDRGVPVADEFGVYSLGSPFSFASCSKMNVWA